MWTIFWILICLVVAIIGFIAVNILLNLRKDKNATSVRDLIERKIETLRIDFGAVPKIQREKAFSLVVDRISQMISIDTIGLLSETDKDEFDNLLGGQQGTPEGEKAILEFLRSKIRGFDMFIIHKITEFKKLCPDVIIDLIKFDTEVFQSKPA